MIYISYLLYMNNIYKSNLYVYNIHYNTYRLLIDIKYILYISY